MTLPFKTYSERDHDHQDGIERHVWGEQQYVEGAGSIIKVNGTDTEDQEATVLNIGGASFNLPKGSNTEVFLLSGGSDTNLKLAILTIPFDKQRKWEEGAGGIQHPTNPDIALEFKDGRVWLTKGTLMVGESGTLEIGNGTMTLRGDVTIAGKLNVNGDVNFAGASNLSNPIVGPGVNTPIPGFNP